MASVETPGRQRYVTTQCDTCLDLLINTFLRSTLPSISNFDFEKYRLDNTDTSRFPSLSNLHVPKNVISSPPTTYSGPPPPYSSAPSVSINGHSMSGYASPPESSSRRSTRDEKDSPKGTLLPSISEALKSADVAPVSQPYSTTSVSISAVAQSFADAPKGPGNPFSQPGAPASALRSSISSTSAILDPSPIKAVPPPPIPPDTRLNPLNTMSSPRSTAPVQRYPATLPANSSTLDPPCRSSYTADANRPGYPFPDYQSNQMPLSQQAPSSFHVEHPSKTDDSRNPFTKSNPPPYGETVKRHLDGFDAELGLNEVCA